MKHLLVFACLSLNLLIFTLFPQSTLAQIRRASFQQTSIQGEIAYVKDGDIWLLDLLTGKSQQLTADGNNRWPTWSPDGKYLLYTHTEDGERFDLYILDTMQRESRLLATNSCCALWERGDRINHLSVGDGTVAIADIWPDGTDQRFETSPLSYGSGVLPTGNLMSNIDGLPLEVVSTIGHSRLTVYADFLGLEGDKLVVPTFNDPEDPTCSWYNASFNEATSQYAVGFMRDQGRSKCEFFQSLPGEPDITFATSLGILLFTNDGSDIRELPWLAYPVFSPDGRYLIAEQYTQAADPRAARLEGLALYNLQNEESSILLVGAGQPAWRPEPAIPEALARYTQPGERMITLEPALSLGGSQVRLHILTTGSYRNTNAAEFFRQASSTFFEQQQVVALLVTMNGQPLAEPTLLKEILLMYATASVLYGDLAYDVTLPDLTSELQAVLENPAFQDVALNEELAGVFSGQSGQSEQALAAILTDQTSISHYLFPVLDTTFTENTIGQITNVEAGIELFRNAVETDHLVERGIWKNLEGPGVPAPDLWQNLLRDLNGLSQDENIPILQEASSFLTNIRLLIHLLFVSHLQQERIEWLNLSLELIAEGPTALDRNQLRAAASVIQEAEILEKRRTNVIADFLRPELIGLVLNGDEQTAVQASTQLTARVIDPAGYRLMAHAASSALTANMIDSSTGALLYGSDELYVHFHLAERSSEWQYAFGTARRYIQDTARQNLPEDSMYEGQVAYYFSRLMLLEILAAVETQRAYADGVDAVFRLPDPTVLISGNKEEWQARVTELREQADLMELAVLNTFARPAWLSAAMNLAFQRKTEATTLLGIQQAHELPILRPGWTSYTHSYGAGSLLVKDNMVWMAPYGSFVRWHITTGKYDKINTEYGLISNSVRVIFPSNDGAIWFGTRNGVSRLDTNGEWSVFTTDDGLAANSVQAIVQSDDGSLWFGTYDSGVSRLEPNGNWTTFTSADGLIDNEVLAIAQADDGTLWFGSQKGATQLGQNGEWSTFTTTHGLVADSINVIFPSADGALWFGTSNGVSRLAPDGSWSTFLNQHGYDGVNIIFQSTDGTLWFGTEESGVSRYDSNGNWVTYSEFDGLVSNYVSGITQSDDGSFWFSTRRGLSRLDPDGSWTTLTIDDPPGVSSPLAMIQAADGAFWFTSRSEGISRLAPDGSWTTFTWADGLASDNVFTVTEDGDGAIWFGTSEGVSRLDLNGIWTTFPKTDGLVGDTTLEIAESNDGALWFGGSDGLSRRALDGTWSTVIAGDGAVDNAYVQSIFQSDDGAMWIGTGAGVNRLDRDGSWSSFTTVNGVTIKDVQSIAQSFDGVLWFGTLDSGVVRLDTDGNYTLLTVADGLAGNTVRAIFQSDDGNLWFGTEAGASRLSPEGNWMTLTTQDGLADNSVLTIIQSADGALWFGTGSGVSRLDLKTILQSQ